MTSKNFSNSSRTREFGVHSKLWVAHPKDWRRPQPIHARAETVEAKEPFRTPFHAGQRGIVVFRTFNEGKEVLKPSGKTETQQWTIDPQDGQPRGFAFVWRRFEIADMPAPMLACVKVTVPASDRIRQNIKPEEDDPRMTAPKRTSLARSATSTPSVKITTRTASTTLGRSMSAAKSAFGSATTTTSRWMAGRKTRAIRKSRRACSPSCSRRSIDYQPLNRGLFLRSASAAIYVLSPETCSLGSDLAWAVVFTGFQPTAQRTFPFDPASRRMGIGNKRPSSWFVGDSFFGNDVLIVRHCSRHRMLLGDDIIQYVSFSFVIITLSGEPKSTQHICRTTCRGGFSSVYMTAEGNALKEQYQWEARSQ